MKNNRLKSLGGFVFKIFSGLSVALQGFYLEVVVYVSSLVFITLFLTFALSFVSTFIFSAIVFFVSILIWTKTIKIKSEKVKKVLNHFAKTIKITGSFIVLYYILNLVFNPSNYLVQTTLPLIKFLEEWANKTVIEYIFSYGFFIIGIVIYGIIIVWLDVKLKKIYKSRIQNKKIENLIDYFFAIIFIFGFALLLSFPIFKENFDYFFGISYPYLKWFFGFSIFSIHLIYLFDEFKKLLISKTQIPFLEK